MFICLDQAVESHFFLFKENILNIVMSILFPLGLNAVVLLIFVSLYDLCCKKNKPIFISVFNFILRETFPLEISRAMWHMCV